MTYDDEAEYLIREIAEGGDPGPLGDDEPQLRPLCRECVRDLPTGHDGLCEFCRVLDDAGGGDGVTS
jgi:hypothetical protein